MEVVGTGEGLAELLGIAVMELIEHPRERLTVQGIDGECLLTYAILLHTYLLIRLVDGEVVRRRDQLICPRLATAELVLEAPIARSKEHHDQGSEGKGDKGLQPQALENTPKGDLVHSLCIL